jgi:hypothetical protein
MCACAAGIIRREFFAPKKHPDRHSSAAGE